MTSRLLYAREELVVPVSFCQFLATIIIETFRLTAMKAFLLSRLYGTDGTGGQSYP